MSTELVESGSKEIVKSYANLKYESVHAKIQEFYLEYITKNKKVPKVTEIAKGAGVTRKTVYTHLDDLKLSFHTPKHKIAFDTVLLALEKKASEGDVAAMKLYLQVVGEWSEKQDTAPKNVAATHIEITYVNDTTVKHKNVEAAEYEEINGD